MVYYKISHVDGRITNPEQQIASDVPRFCSELSDLVHEDLTVVTDVLLYSLRLSSYASPKYIFWILAYVIGAGTVMRNFSPSFGKLMSKEQQLEGEYRQVHSRLRTHAESIAFYGGETREESHIREKFKSLVRHMSVVIHEHCGYADHIYELMSISRELIVQGSSSLRRNGSRNYVSEANYIEFENVKVVTPNGNVLVEDLSRRVESGSNLLRLTSTIQGMYKNGWKQHVGQIRE
ncbi:hypothetical protein U1Q18_013745 [Sarracenia purpurea var. burkii]